MHIGRLSPCTLQIWLLREPLDRIESMWSYRRDLLHTSVGRQCSLAQALKAELVYLDSPVGANLVRQMLEGRASGDGGLAVGSAFALARSAGVRPIAGSGCVLAPRDKIVLQTFHFPQLLHFLDASQVAHGRALALQSEQLFADPTGVLTDVVGPFVHGAGGRGPGAAGDAAGNAARTEHHQRALRVRQRGRGRALRAPALRSNPSVHQPRSPEYVSLRCKLVCTFAPFNAALNQLLATDKRLVAYPPVPQGRGRGTEFALMPSNTSAGSPWWPETLYYPECATPDLNCSSRPFL